MNPDIVYSPVSDIDPGELRRLILEKGLLVIRNDGCSRDDFMWLSNQVGEDFVTVESGKGRGEMGGGYSGRDLVDGIPSLFSVTGKAYRDSVPVHGELYFQQLEPPHMLWFYCKTPPRHGGQTVFCDGEELFAALPHSIQQRLLDSNLVYLRRMDVDVWPAYFGIGTAGEIPACRRINGIEVSLNDDGSMTTRFSSPAVRMRRGRPVFINNLLPFALREIRLPKETRASVRRESGENIPVDEVLEIERIAASLSITPEWRTGDIAIVDNTRMLHGRERVLDLDREIYVRLSNADFIRDFLHESS